MKREIAQFMLSKPFGFISEDDVKAIMARPDVHEWRLIQVLVRCGGCRFVCAIQDVAHLIRCVNAGGDYVRDVAFLARDLEVARKVA